MATANPKKTSELGSTDTVEPEESASATPKTPEKQGVTVDVEQELRGLHEELLKISAKNTTRLVTLENNVNRYRKLIDESKSELIELAESMKVELKNKFETNAEHQLLLKNQTEELIAQLEVALEEGRSLAALPTWDKIQGNISNTNGEIRQSLQSLTQKFKSKITELRDWKIFAATEKKKDLIQQIDKLKDSKMQPGEKSKNISKLHKEWKALGRSNQNEELWQQFKTLSDVAYEPCKQYFKDRKQLMAANLKARRELCDQLESQLASYQENLPSTSELSKQLRKAEEEWKKHAPVEQSRIKQLQKRYYASINQLRKMRKEGLRGSAKRKSEIIEQAEALLKLEDHSQAMSQAKQLQQEWKSAGQSSYKEDKEFWEKFRAICDEIFSHRDKTKTESNTKSGQSQKQLIELLDSLENLLKLEDEELRSEKPNYHNLQQSFAAALDEIHSKAKGKFRDRFNNLKRKLDSRLRSLPDKKSQALLQLVQKCLSYLQPLESKLLESEAENLDETRQLFCKDQWFDLTQDEDSEHLNLLHRRAELLRDTKDSKAYMAAAKLASDQLRELCIEAEIRAGTDTPTDDQSKRMELQLSQLKQGFGKRQPDRENDIKFIHESRIKCLCVGPVLEKEQQQFSSRLEKSLQRLV